MSIGHYVKYDGWWVLGGDGGDGNTGLMVARRHRPSWLMRWANRVVFGIVWKDGPADVFVQSREGAKEERGDA